MTAVYKRELRTYFQSMTGPVFIAFLLAFTGIYFVAYNKNVDRKARVLRALWDSQGAIMDAVPNRSSMTKTQENPQCAGR